MLAKVNYFSLQYVWPEGGASRKKMLASIQVKARHSALFAQCLKVCKGCAACHFFRKSAPPNIWRKVFLQSHCKARFDTRSRCLAAVVPVMRRALSASDRRCCLCDTRSKWEPPFSQ